MDRTPEDIQDELLVLQCQDGDATAMRTLIARWQPRLFRFAGRLTNEREAARDIVQETWIAVVRGLHRLDDPASFRSWAYRIVRHKHVDWTRRMVVRHRAARVLQRTADGDAYDPPQEADETDDVTRLRKAMVRLPDEQRAILTLHYLDGMSVAEIARVLGVPAGTVKSRLFHARSSLKQVLERVQT